MKVTVTSINLEQFEFDSKSDNLIYIMDEAIKLSKNDVFTIQIENQKPLYFKKIIPLGQKEITNELFKTLLYNKLKKNPKCKDIHGKDNYSLFNISLEEIGEIFDELLKDKLILRSEDYEQISHTKNCR